MLRTEAADRDSQSKGGCCCNQCHYMKRNMHHRMQLEKKSTAGASAEDAEKREIGGSSMNSGSGNGVPLRKRRKLVHIGEHEHIAATTSREPGMKSAPEQVEKIIPQCTTDQAKTTASLGPVGYQHSKTEAELKYLDEAGDAADILLTMVEEKVQLGHFRKSDEAQSGNIQLLEKELEKRQQTEKQLTEKQLEVARNTINGLEERQELNFKYTGDLHSRLEHAEENAAHCLEVIKAQSTSIGSLTVALEKQQQTKERLRHDLDDEARATTKMNSELQKLAQAAQETEKKHREAIDGLVKREEYAEISKQQAEKQLEVARNTINGLEERQELNFKYTEDLHSRLERAEEHAAHCLEVIKDQSTRIGSLNVALEKREEQLLHDLDDEARATTKMERELQKLVQAAQEIETKHCKAIDRIEKRQELTFKYTEILLSRLEYAQERAAHRLNIIVAQTKNIRYLIRRNDAKLCNPGNSLEADIVQSV